MQYFFTLSKESNFHLKKIQIYTYRTALNHLKQYIVNTPEINEEKKITLQTALSNRQRITEKNDDCWLFPLPLHVPGGVENRGRYRHTNKHPGNIYMKPYHCEKTQLSTAFLCQDSA